MKLSSREINSSFVTRAAAKKTELNAINFNEYVKLKYQN